MHLNRIRAHTLGHFAGKEFGHGGFLEAGLACIFERCRVVDELARRFNLRGHVGQLELHGLVLKYGLTKAHTFFAVAQRRIKSRARHANALRRDANAPALQAAERNFQTLAFLA